MRPVLAHIVGLFHGFLRWWLAELAAMVPDGVRAAFAARGTAVVVVDPEAAELTVTRISGGKRRELARLPHPGHTAGASAPVRPVPARRRLASADEVVLRLPPETVLRKTVNLPLAAEANLRDILYFELDRQTPFRPDEAYFDHRVLERLPGTQRLTVELTVLARAAVDPILAQLARWGIEPTRVEAVGGDGGGWSCRLPARGETGDDEGLATLSRLVNPGLAVLALLLAGTAVYLPMQRQAALLADLQAELAIEKARADDTLGLRETLAALREEALHLVTMKRDDASVLEIWNEVTRIMPDHSFALELRLRERQVELVGQSEAATGLLDVIEGSSLFHRATFRSPITRGHGSEGERFHLAFEVGRPEPEQRAER